MQNFSLHNAYDSIYGYTAYNQSSHPHNLRSLLVAFQMSPHYLLITLVISTIVLGDQTFLNSILHIFLNLSTVKCCMGLKINVFWNFYVHFVEILRISGKATEFRNTMLKGGTSVFCTKFSYSPNSSKNFPRSRLST